MGQRTSQQAARLSTQGRGLGRALEAGFARAERQAALAEARDQALELIMSEAPPRGVAAVLETDVGLTSAVIRTAGQAEGPGGVGSVPEAVERLGPAALEAVVRSTLSYDVLTQGAEADLGPDRLRVHSLAVQRAADQIAELVGWKHREELTLAAILHDIGRPALERMHPDYTERFDRHRGTPDDRIAAERRELGIDHALVGAVLTRDRWGVRPGVAEAIERHHNRDAEGMAAIVRTADMIVAHLEDAPVEIATMREAADACGLGEQGLRQALYELPMGSGGARPRASGPCPLSARELDVIRGLAEGKVYKQIAEDLGLSASTVRTHVHNAYGKLGVLDRVQAVLMATERGWI